MRGGVYTDDAAQLRVGVPARVSFGAIGKVRYLAAHWFVI